MSWGLIKTVVVIAALGPCSGLLSLWGMATCVESRNWMTRRTVEVTREGSSP
jgi:hypothetical protein